MDEARREPIGSPVQGAGEPERDAPEAGVALCLSGGGYRAMLFHVGALWRLNELGRLARQDRVSSVSGGSITAAVLALHWGELGFGADGVAARFEEQVAGPARALAGETIDGGSIVGGILQPGASIAAKVAGAYRRHLFGDATLQALPDAPRFVINATNVQTGSLWRFSKPYMADYRVGLVRDPDVELAVAVAASSAFPPVLSPLQLAVEPSRWDDHGRGPLHVPPYTTDVVLSDGGVYDNLGLETAWKRYRTILVSDGGGHIGAKPRPKLDWLRQSKRVLDVIDSQVRGLRKRQAIESFQLGLRQGTYWGIRTDIADYGLPAGSLPCPPEQTLALAATKTRLRRMEDTLQERLINWGYAICDVALRTWVDPDTSPLP